VLKTDFRGISSKARKTQHIMFWYRSLLLTVVGPRTEVLTSAGHNRRQFDESTMNLSIDIVDCCSSIDLRNRVGDSSLQN
jgi:hypothetical protein